VDPSYANTDWYDVIFRDATPMMQHNLSLRGGTKDVKYFTSFGLQDQEGAFRSGDLDYQRYNVRSNLDVNISKDLSMRIDLSYSKDYRNSPGVSVSNMYNQLETSKPMYPAVLPDPDRAAWGGFQPRAPYAATQKRFGGFNENIRDRLMGVMSLDYKIPFLRGLSAELKMNYSMRHGSAKALRRSYDIWTYDYDTGEYGYEGTQNAVSSVQETYDRTIQLQPSFFLKYKNKFGDHSIDTFAGVETRDINTEAFSARRINLLSADIPFLNSGNEEGQTTSGSASEQGWKSYLGRAIYKYKNKYILNFTMRADAAAHKFPENSRWGYFPSASLAWKISEEGFLKGSNAIDLLKLRTSYSVAGSTLGIGDWRYLSGFDISGGTYLIDEGSGASIYDLGLPNSEITWRENRISNIGLDGSFWKGLLGFEIDVFYREQANVFETNSAEVPYTYSFGLPPLNSRKNSNRGFDIMLTHKNRINDDFSYNVNAMFSWNRQRIEETSTDNLIDLSTIDPEDFTTDDDYQAAIAEANQFNFINQREGQWTNRFFGYVSDGLFQSQEQIDNHPVDQDQNGNTSLLPGDIVYKDLDGDGVITSLDQDIIGFGGTANINFGLDLALTYKAFSFSALFQGATNVNKNITGAARFPFMNGQSVPYDYHLKHRFVYDADLDANTNTNATMPMVTSTGGMENNLKTSDYWLLDASYVRLKALNLTYSVPTNLLEKIGCSRLDVIASGTNLVTWSKMGTFKHTFDPESSFSQNGRQYPIMKTYSLGVNIAF
jgi:TonB-linked SusC/RagA family outer membrane protein